jgi:hypothetical protein
VSVRRPLHPNWCILCRNYRPVLWIGPVSHDGQTVPAYACEDCCEWVRQYISFFTRERDSRAAS